VLLSALPTSEFWSWLRQRWYFCQIRKILFYFCLCGCLCVFLSTILLVHHTTGFWWEFLKGSGGVTQVCNLLVVSDHNQKLHLYTAVHKKRAIFIFFNSSMQHWPILIIFGMQHQEETRRKWLYFWPSQFHTVTTLPCEMQVVEPAVCEWCERLLLAFTLEEDILSTCCYKEDVMWHVWLFEIQ